MYQKDGFWIVECQKCGLVFVNPQLPPKKIHDHYDKTYFQSKDGQDKTRYFDYNFRYLKDKEKLRFKDIFENLENLLPEKGRFLDVGAATGFLVKEAQKRCWQAEGVEISRWACEYGKKLKVKMHCGDIFQAKFKKETFDVITMLDIFEHLQDPMRVLREAYRILKKGGVIYIETINFDNFITKYFIGKKYKHMVPAFHLLYFGRRQIHEFFKLSKLNVVKEKLTSTSVGDYEFEGLKMYWQYFKKLLNPQGDSNFAFNDVIKIYGQKGNI